jgi:CxxH/CxxC protein (TIGR04129 family)
MDKQIKEYLVCEEHVEYAIDDYVDDNELAPDITLVEGNQTCDRCDSPAKYRLVPQT